MPKVAVAQSPAGATSAKTTATVAGKQFDPALESLFATSSGPIKVPQRRNSPIESPQKVEYPTTLREESGAKIGASTRYRAPHAAAQEEQDQPPRKKRRVVKDDLEASYFKRIAQDEEREKQGRDYDEDGTSSSGHSVDNEEDDEEDDAITPEPVAPIPRHETQDTPTQDEAAAKARRTVFLSNVSTEAITSKKAKKSLTQHLETILAPTADKKESAKVESIRFRSTAYASGVGPKRAAFAKKELMDETMKSTNAYAVFSAEWAAKKAAKQLNGSVVLDRHLRVDYLANPSVIDHKRCVFVGNLSFVDEAIVEETGPDGKTTTKKPRARAPADAEEGLWRTFSTVGTVESVRVVRDKETRVGKGFAYVQFADQNGVEAALLLNEKKFPPMLPRKLRVMRAKRTTDRPRNVNPSDRRDTRGSRDVRGRNSGPRQDGKSSKIIFEGHRASKPSNLGGGKGDSKKRKHGVRANRSSRRAAAFKAGGGKKKRAAT